MNFYAVLNCRKKNIKILKSNISENYHKILMKFYTHIGHNVTYAVKISN